MLTILEHISLKPYHTFHIEVYAKYFVEVKSIDDILELMELPIYKSYPNLIIGGGSNLLFCKDYEGLIIKNAIKGIEVIREDHDDVYLKANAGEVWHELVIYCIEHGFGGIENLSLIPGCVGAAPMQNIGAYGIEIKELIHEVHALHKNTKQIEIFSNEACQFGYRESVFKRALKDQYIILSVVLKLTKKPQLNTSYGAIQAALAAKNIVQPSIKEVSEAVIAIRSSKLPNPDVLGNAGSFFKNPEISKEAFDIFNKQFPTAPYYLSSNELVKIPAGWLIEQCGWKGKIVGKTGAHKDQALVLVNYGNAQGNEIYALALAIQQSVKEKFHIDIEPEVNIYK
ncbi:MAG: UDP-N-acetylmuramate dehydrogenase [Bacteroidota bacterium]